MAKRTLRCKKCSGVLGKEQRLEGFCQYCQLKGKIDQEIDNIKKLSDESGDPDLLRQLDELEMMGSALKKKREEETTRDEFEETKPNIFDMDTEPNDNEDVKTLGFDEEDKKPELHSIKNETDLDDCDYAKSLPKDWKAKNVRVGFGSIIKHFIDPNGRRYVSRIDAIRTLSKLESCLEEVGILRSGLIADGWMAHPLLPEGWFAKPACKTGGNNSLRFLTDKNEWFIGIKKAIRLINNSEEYTGLDLENLHTFFGEYSSFQRGTDENWMDGDEYLPEGWRYKITHGSNGDYARVLSPGGESFASKSKALAYMVKNGHEAADIKKMLNALVYDGWVESSFLPADWRYRKCKTGRNEYNFLSPEGVMFQSRKTLVAFMRASENDYNDEDINNIDALKGEIRAKWVNDKHDWIEDDETVPPGWKIRYFDGLKANKKPRKRCYILSPSGAQFQSRTKALQFMIQNSHPFDQISCMRSQLERESWGCHPMLPENWRIRRKLSGKGHLFFTSEGLILSLKSALSHMEKASNKYTAEDSDGLVFVAKGFTKHLTNQSYDWKENESVPLGWKVRQVPISGSHVREYFLTPRGAQIGGRVKTIQFLLNQGQSVNDSDVEILHSGLANVGWQEDTNIVPLGWMKKQVMKKTGKYKFISPDFKEFHSIGTVYHYMRANNFPIEVVNKAKEQLDVKAMLSNKRMPNNGNVERTYKWQKAVYLPPGWKVAEKKFRYGHRKQLFLSPNGLLLQKAVLAFQVMVDEGAGVQYLQNMQQMLNEEGWEEDSNLPDGWRLNVSKKHFPENFSDEDDLEALFLTEKAKILTSSSALKMMTNSEEFSEKQVSSFISMIDYLSQCPDRGWKEDSSLPKGWKIKEIDLSFKKEVHLMSPELEQFDSIFAAFTCMTSKKDFFQENDVHKMKDKLSEEGFEKNEKLPAGWLIVRHRRENLFELLSKEGILYQTLDAAQEFIEDSDEYSDKDILDIEELCMGEVESYLNTRVITNPGFGKFATGTGLETSPEQQKMNAQCSSKKGKKRKLCA